MKTTTLRLCGASFIITLVLLLLSIPVEGQGNLAGSTPTRIRIRASSPTIVAVTPREAPNNLDTTIIITGTNFTSPLTVTLNSVVLPAAAWINSTSLTATVPWGLNPGVYTVTVTNPDGGTGSLTNAFTVTQALGVWTTGGPYGGWIENMVVSPQISTTVYAFAINVGLFRSNNGGSSWDLVRPVSSDDVRWGHRIAVKPGAPQTVLFGDFTGLYKSPDGGDSWQKTPFCVNAIAYAPSSPNHIYVVCGNTVYVSSDDGATWQSHFLSTSINFTDIAVDPITDTIAYGGTWDGHILKTIDGGATWQDLYAGFPTEPIDRLTIDPINPNHVGSSLN